MRSAPTIGALVPRIGRGLPSHHPEVFVSRIVHATTLFALATSLAGQLHAMTPPPPPPGGKVFVFSCAVMFATRSRGTAANRPFGPQRDNGQGVRSSTSKEYNLAGYDSTAFQRITDQICAGAPAELTAAGYEVLTEGVTDHYGYRKALGSAQESPQRQSAEGTAYLVYAPTGQKIMDAFVVGDVGAVNLFTGEMTTGNKLGAHPVTLLYSVDFANIETDKKVVDVDVEMTIGLTMTSADPSGARCSKGAPFGEFKNLEFCYQKKASDRVAYALDETQETRTKGPIVSVEQYKDAGTAALTALSVLSIVADRGRSGGVASYKKFSVTVDPSKYEASAVEGAKGLIAPAMKWINEPESRPKKKR
jgi:hypothetical protein